MGNFKCCVGGCSSTNATHRLYLFPQKEEVRKLWLNFVVPTNPDLIVFSKEKLVTRTRVCEKHFDRYELGCHGQRRMFSYPCLFTEKEMAYGIPLLNEKWSVNVEHNYYKNEEETEPVTEPSLLTPITGFETGLEHTYSKLEEGSVAHLFRSYRTDDTMTDKPSDSDTHMGTDEDAIITMENSQNTKYSKNSKSKKNKKLMKQLINLAADNSNDPVSKGIPKVSNVLQEDSSVLKNKTKTYLAMQLKQATKDPTVKSFSLDEQLMALLLMKQSQKEYKVLRKMYTLPNRKTLKLLAEKLSRDIGFDTHMFEETENNSENKSTDKKLCLIVLDDES